MRTLVFSFNDVIAHHPFAFNLNELPTSLPSSHLFQSSGLETCKLTNSIRVPLAKNERTGNLFGLSAMR